MTKKIVTALVTCLLVAAAGYYGMHQYLQSRPLKISIGNESYLGATPFYIAEAKGFLQANHINPDFVAVDNDPDCKHESAFSSGELQGLIIPVDRDALSFPSADKGTMVLLLDESAGAEGLLASDKIKTAADLKGATIGVDKSSTNYFFLLSFLDKYQVPESGLKILNMGASKAGHTFTAGSLDSAVGWESSLKTVSSRQGGHALATTKDFPATCVDGLVLRPDFVKAHPKEAAALTRCWFQAIDYWRQHPAEGDQIVAKAMNMQPRALGYFKDGFKFYGRQENVQLFSESNPNNVYNLAARANRYWLERNLVKVQTDPHTYIKPDLSITTAK
jgi:NitT/TauT family transport system substrate-binding protein